MMEKDFVSTLQFPDQSDQDSANGTEKAKQCSITSLPPRVVTLLTITSPSTVSSTYTDVMSLAKFAFLSGVSQPFSVQPGRSRTSQKTAYLLNISGADGINTNQQIK